MREYHGATRSPEHITWTNIKQRCHNKNNRDYKNYGARGIKVCDRWRTSFKSFYDDMGQRPSKDHSIERLNNNEGYCKENCIWATRVEQGRNRRTNVFLTINGQTKASWEWAEIYGITSDDVCRRLKYGWPPDDVLKTPVEPRVHELSVKIKGKTKTLMEWCKVYKIKHATVWTRICRGWGYVDAVTKPLRRVNKISNA